MNKQILVLSASFRKGGNSDTLCDQFIKGAVEAGNRVEKIYLNDCKINFCRGCGVCNTTHKCVQHDDIPVALLCDNYKFITKWHISNDRFL